MALYVSIYEVEEKRVMTGLSIVEVEMLFFGCIVGYFVVSDGRVVHVVSFSFL